MADKIMSCVVEKDASEVVIQYHVAYEVEHELAKNNYCVVVKADEMTDPSSQAEAVAKANVKALEIKNAWIASMPTSESTALISEPQDVTL